MLASDGIYICSRYSTKCQQRAEQQSRPGPDGKWTQMWKEVHFSIDSEQNLVADGWAGDGSRQPVTADSAPIRPFNQRPEEQRLKQQLTNPVKILEKLQLNNHGSVDHFDVKLKCQGAWLVSWDFELALAASQQWWHNWQPKGTCGGYNTGPGGHLWFRGC